MIERRYPPSSSIVAKQFPYFILICVLFLFPTECAFNAPLAPRTDEQTPNLLGDPVNTADPFRALLISEIGSAYFADSSTWIELYNRAVFPVKLSGYALACSSRLANDHTIGYSVTYELPLVTIPPGTYLLLRAKPSADFVDAGRVAYLSKTLGVNGTNLTFTPRFGTAGTGFVEILYRGETVDFVRFGADASTPTTGRFQGTAPPVPAPTPQSYGYSLARSGALRDSDRGLDFSFSPVATPGGPNDVTDATDEDRDGIPDACERPGSTFAGMPLYEWGARAGRRDLFLHIDYMSKSDPGIVPNQAALHRVRDAFRRHGIELHFDVGDLFSSAKGIDPENDKLSDFSHQVPWAAAIAMGDGGSGVANAYTYKNAYMPLARRNIFHYLVMANSLKPDGTPGPGGTAEYLGNDLLITLGGWFGTGASVPSNYVINWQAATLMHELGHNLGLRHGGFEDHNDKPNYLSVMNYLYQISGLPVIGSPSEGDRWKFVNGALDGLDAYAKLSNGPDRPASLFAMDYSSGGGILLQESSINEAAGLGRGDSAWVDFNANRAVDGALSMNLNPNWSGASGESLRDFDDWGNLQFAFQRVAAGDSHAPRALAPGFFVTPAPVDEERPLAPECPFPRTGLLPR